MKCCHCNVEVDTKVNTVPPKWYGVVVGDTLVRVICDKCIKTVEGMKEYEKE